MIQKLSLSEKIGYGLGDMAANFVFQAMLALQLSFYTDTFGLTPAQAGTLFLVVGLCAAVLNPVMGAIADRTNTRWGKFRPYLLWTAVPFGIIGVLTFTTPNLSAGSKIIYAYVTYALLRIVYTVNNVPYASLTAVITGDPDERTSIASWRQIFANSAGFIVQSLAVPMIAWFGQGNRPRAISGPWGFSRVLGGLLFIVAFLSTKERIQPNPKQQSSLGEDLADLLKNGPWIALFLATTCSTSSRSRCAVESCCRSSSTPPETRTSSVGSTASAWPRCWSASRFPPNWRRDSASVICSSPAWCSTGFSVGVLLVLPGGNGRHLRFRDPAPVSFGCSCPVLWAMMADVADYGEWKTGRRATGTVTAAVVFALWLGLALGGAIAGWLFQAYGYVPNATQTAHSLTGILMVASVYSGLAFFATAVCLVFYPITRAKNREIADELAERRLKFAPQETPGA